MLRKAYEELRGGEVLARQRRLGAVEDLYYEGACWRVRYLLLDGSSRALLSVACVARAPSRRGRILVNLSPAQLAIGAEAWPVQAARGALESERLCSATETIGMRALAQDGAAGHVADLLVDDEQWSIEYLLVHFPSAHAGRRLLLVPLDWVGPMDRRRRALYLQRTREQLSTSPAL